jgi:hypothetical protein
MLREFFKDYLAAAEGDASYPESFKENIKHGGLCFVAARYAPEVFKAMPKFKETYPFNESGYDYLRETIGGFAHRNPKRLAWVREQLNELA